MAKHNNSSKTFAEIFAEVRKGETKNVRKEVQRLDRLYFLIVCEGERTEPNYFKSIRNSLPQEDMETIDIQGEGANTITIVNRAIQLKNERNRSYLPNYDEVWAVFDRDSFPSERVNNAILIADANHVSCGISNEAFELWYLLHFMYFDTCVSRHQYAEMLNEQFSKAMNKPFKYQKNQVDIYELLQEFGDEDLAIRYAKRLFENTKDLTPAEACPSTTIYQLICKLNQYIKPNYENTDCE